MTAAKIEEEPIDQYDDLVGKPMCEFITQIVEIFNRPECVTFVFQNGTGHNHVTHEGAKQLLALCGGYCGDIYTAAHQLTPPGIIKLVQ